MRILVESTELQTLPKKDKSGTFQLQTCYVFETDQNGNEKKYPTEISIFPQQDQFKNSIPYAIGEYTLSPDVIRIKNGRFELGFITLVPSKKLMKAS